MKLTKEELTIIINIINQYQNIALNGFHKQLEVFDIMKRNDLKSVWIDESVKEFDKLQTIKSKLIKMNEELIK